MDLVPVSLMITVIAVHTLYSVLLTVYLLFFGLLTVALVLATDEEEPSTYDTPLAKFRLFCEVIVILGVLLDFIGEIVDFCTN